ncbi:hypothetical protein FNB15_03575 [Ferrovibrio terrae]|uniref:Uncharacterized protein n=1 Tax=Ferrovibrio terrae TaxID=2594003 RepID=A0A516GXZ5_9PROT|nr:hypothetical protein [Ferrovibrio terrae]QDO96414.1 hypothetical protein FNB15_03575 [Ferrovibrio terrae]
MGLDFRNLDDRTRALMVEEIDLDGDNLYLSRFLTDDGQAQWPGLLRDAALNGNDDTLAAAVRGGRLLRRQYQRRKPKGGFTMAEVPVTAHRTLAEGQFNVYYMRALARRAIEERRSIIVYRAKRVQEPRPESQRMIDRQLEPNFVLETLRADHGVEPETGIPLPNSGLTVELQ